MASKQSFLKPWLRCTAAKQRIPLHRNNKLAFAGLALALLQAIGTLLPQETWAVGAMPVPTLKGVVIRANTTYDSDTKHYRYHYRVENPATNTGQVWNLQINIRTEASASMPRFSSEGLTIPRGTSLRSFDEMLQRFAPVGLGLEPGMTIVPIGQQVPLGWNGGFGRNGYARFSSGDETSNVLPGQSLTGFVLISPGLPTIREAQVEPWWIFIVPDHDEVTDEEREEVGRIERDLPWKTFSLGPGDQYPGSFEHWSKLAADIDRAVTLGWVPSASFAQTVRDQLAFARAALDQQDGTLAKTRLRTLLTTMRNSQPSDRNQEIFDLVVLNVESLIEHTEDTPIPVEPVYSLTPRTATLPIGTLHTLTAKIVNAANHNAPMPDEYVYVAIVDGRHANHEAWSGSTDENGEFKFEYTGTTVGVDRIVWAVLPANRGAPKNPPLLLASSDDALPQLGINIEPYPGALAEAMVTWTAGPDLVIPRFSPPYVQSQGGNPVYVSEFTQNIGEIASAPSTTRYYLSTSLPLDPGTARVIGERRVAALAPQEESAGGMVQFTLPSDLAPGVFHIAACADADHEIVELDEDNNCSFSEYTESVSRVVMVTRPDNLPPNCSQATPSAVTLWPPNHKLHEVRIQGVTDHDGDPVSISVGSIRQDEPVNGLGDGDTSPDGFFGIDTWTARVRAERSGILNGRVYTLGFTAQDGRGGSCEGTVTVGVPHDRGAQATPINDGANYDSTLP